MNKEDKELLLKDLSARLPYGVKFAITNKKTGTLKSIGITKYGLIPINLFYKKPSFYLINEFGNIEYKPYLRPMSSMTEEERSDMGKAIQKNYINPNGEIKSSGADNLLMCTARQAEHFIDWLNAHHFDYRGLIEKGFALEAPEGMYKTE